MGAYALTMDVGIDVPARDFGYGISTPAMKVANLDLMSRRQNYLTFAGILAVVGVVVMGFASLRTNKSADAPEGYPAPNSSTTLSRPVADGMKLCPYCAEEVRAAAMRCKHCQSDLPIIDALVETGSPHIRYEKGYYKVGGLDFDKLEEAQRCLAQWSGPPLEQFNAAAKG